MMKFKCDICGRFIPVKDFDDNNACRKLVTPDSHFTTEEWETLCKRCNKRDKKYAI